MSQEADAAPSSRPVFIGLARDPKGRQTLGRFRLGEKTLRSNRVVTGLAPRDLLTDVALRPRTGVLYALSRQYRLYRVDVPTARATQVARPLALPGQPTQPVFDIDPAHDTGRILYREYRYTGRSEPNRIAHNLAVDLKTGAVTEQGAPHLTPPPPPTALERVMEIVRDPTCSPSSRPCDQEGQNEEFEPGGLAYRGRGPGQTGIQAFVSSYVWDEKYRIGELEPQESGAITLRPRSNRAFGSRDLDLDVARESRTLFGSMREFVRDDNSYPLVLVQVDPDTGTASPTGHPYPTVVRKDQGGRADESGPIRDFALTAFVVTPASPTRVSLAATPVRTAGGPAAVLTGKVVRASGGAVAGRPVQLLYRPTVGDQPYQVLRTTTTGSDGSYRFTSAPDVKASYRVVFAGETDYLTGATSPRRDVRVRWGVTSTPLDTTVARGVQTVLTGTVKPARSGATVHLELVLDDGTVRRTTTSVSTDENGRFELRRDLPAGTHRIRAGVSSSSDGRNEFGASRPTTISSG